MLKEADSRVKKYFPASTVVFCQLIGSELKRVVNAHAVSEDQQNQVNRAVWEFNTHIFSINAERGSFSPSLHSQVHRVCKGKKRNYYHHLHDGIHLTEELKIKWAEQFLKAALSTLMVRMSVKLTIGLTQTTIFDLMLTRQNYLFRICGCPSFHVWTAGFVW